MARTVTHTFVSAKADSSDATLIQPSHWNASHTITDDSGVAIASDYNFASQSPSIALTSGVTNTVTLTPVPYGVNGTDSAHYLRITGTGGSSETVLITGGTAVAGATSGTITFVPANSHAQGTWSIASATAGIAEAQQHLITNYGAGTVQIGAGTWSVTGSVKYQKNMRFVGTGRATRIKPTTNLAVFDSNVPTKTSSEFTLVADNVEFRDFVIDGTALSTINSAYGIKGTVATSSTEVWGFFRFKIYNIDFDNIYYSIYFHRIRDIEIVGCGLWNNSTITFSDSTTANSMAYNSIDIKIDKLAYVWHYMTGDGTQESMTVPVVSSTNAETFKITNSFFSMRGSLTNTGAGNAITFTGGEDLIVHNCTFINCYAAINLGGFSSAGVYNYAAFVTISECSIDQIWGPAIWLNPGNSTAVNNQCCHVQIIGNQITDLISTQTPANFILVEQYSRQILISDNLFRNLYGSINQVGVVILANATQVTFGPNLWDNETGDVAGCIGIATNASTGSVYGLERNLFRPSVFGTNVSDAVMPVASAATLAIPVGRRTVTVSGTTTITAMTYAGQIGDIVTLLFTGALQVTKGSNIKINANFTSTGTATGSLTLYWDGTNMVEISRSAN